MNHRKKNKLLVVTIIYCLHNIYLLVFFRSGDKNIPPKEINKSTETEKTNMDINETVTVTEPESVKETVTILAVIDIFLLVVATFLNFLAMMLQISTLKRRNLSSQSVLLIHLNGVAFTNIFVNGWAVAIHGFKSKFGLGKERAFVVIYTTAHMAYILNLIFLTLDRLLYVLLKLNYKKYIKTYVLILSVSLIWILSIAFGFFLKYGKYDRAKFFEYSHHVYNGFTTAFAAVAYIIIIAEVLISSKVSGASSNDSLKRIRKFLLPFLIVMTFFLFTYLPGIITAHINLGDRQKILIVGLIGVNILNIISDPLIYIFLQPKIKRQFNKYMNKYLHCWKKTNVIRKDATTISNPGIEMN